MADYIDDPTIAATEELLRRIPKDPIHAIWDNNEKLHRPSSAAFDNDPDGDPMSVTLLSVLHEHSLQPASLLLGHEGFALAAITAALARACGQGVARAPLFDNPAHAVVFGDKPSSVRKKLAKGARWIVAPPS